LVQNDQESTAGPSGLQERVIELESHLGRLQDSDRQLRLFIDGVRDYAVIALDTNNCITGWNAGAERILGYRESEILGKSGSMIFTPEDIENGNMQLEFDSARKTGRAENERWHVRKDGSRFWGSGVLARIDDESGNLVGYGKVMRDLTERKEAQDRLRQSEEHLRLLVENVTDYALFQVDLEGRISSWNPGAERTFGYATEEIEGKPFETLFTGDDREQGFAKQELQRARAEGGVQDERWLVRKDGSRLYARWTTSLAFDSSGQLCGFVKVLQDETERKAREQSSLLTVLENERRRIARELHDDLVQRLAVLEIGLARIRRDLPANAAAAGTELLRLEQQTGMLSNDVRRLSHQLHPSVLEDLGLCAALESLVDEFQSSRSQKIDFLCEGLPAEIPTSIATAMYRIAQEALRNVAKHASGRGVLRVTREGEMLRLTISDAGPGFNAQPDPRRGGLGILSMKERAQLVGGQFSLTSKPGGNTTIDVVIPVPVREGGY